MDGIEKIQAAAIKTPDGAIYPGKDHASILRSMRDQDVPREIARASQQGFVTTKGTFIGRYEASKIAFGARQVPTFTGNLCSEDLMICDPEYDGWED